MKLSELLAYDNIVIQCHDNPDADTIACGFGVYLYLKSKGKEPRLIYGGQNVIRKTNLVMLIRDLKIPIEHVDYLHKPELLVMVDCQYHSGNSAVFEAEHIAVIDHHRICTELPELSEVRSNLGACSTLVWNMLKTEGFDVRGNRELSTALYYGLYTDTGSLTEIVHPLDRDLRDEANFDPAIMRKLRNANLSLEELEVAGAALLHTDYVEEFRAAIVKVGQCDPNILGLISDLVLEVDAIDICVAFNLQPEGVKFSVRSCVKEVKASELAAELCKGIGSGGGHLEKAGGLIPMELMTQEYLKFCKEHHFAPRMEYDAQGRHEQPAASGIKSVIEQRMRDYMGNTDIHGVYKQTYRTDKQSGPMTIVFAKERSQEGVKEALLAGRSVVKFGDILIGSEKNLLSLVKACLSYEVKEVKGNQALVKVTNKSTLNFEILLDNKAGTILGNATVEIKVRLDDKVKFTTTHITDDSRLVIDIASLR